MLAVNPRGELFSAVLLTRGRRSQCFEAFQVASDGSLPLLEEVLALEVQFERPLAQRFPLWSLVAFLAVARFNIAAPLRFALEGAM